MPKGVNVLYAEADDLKVLKRYLKKQTRRPDAFICSNDAIALASELRRESGYGRFDIMLKPRAEHRNFPAVVIEVKAAKYASEDLDALAAEARRQIDEKNYAASLEAEA